MIDRRLVAVTGGVALALSLTSCVESERSTTSNDGSASSGSTGGGTFVFGAAGAPVSFDPFYASDGETFRVTRQIYENLLEFKPGSAEVGPGLAKSWESSEDGLTWTFELQEGVTFHDGTPFDAAAVCANFDRWYNQNEVGQNAAVSYYWNSDFGGFAGDEDSLFESCEATDEMTATITVTRVTSKFPTILGQAAYGISSPTALEQYDANGVQTQGEGFTYPEYATEHPTGTGPFVFDSYNGTTEVTLTRNEDYWGDKAGVDTLIFRIISDENARRQELDAGAINGYDLPNPVDWGGLEEAGNQVEIRPAFNILYLGFNPTTMPELTDDRVRQALYHAINREQLISSQLPDGATLATQFIPDTVTGWNPDIEPYEYDVDRARELLAEAGQEDLTIDLWYPTEVSRPYMPDPQRIFEAVRSDWEAAGITVNGVAKPWTGGYLDGTQTGDAPAYFLGWTGDYNSPANFIGTFFEADDNQFGTHGYDWGPELSSMLREADGIADEDEREQAYLEVNARIAEWLPGLPISHSPPAIVVGPNVQGLVPSPLTAEQYSTITLTD